MRNIKYISVILIITLCSSCLKSGLDDLKSYDEAEVTGINFEYRWIGSNGPDGVINEQLVVKKLAVSKIIDPKTNSISCIVTVPKVDKNFTQDIRDKVSIKNLVADLDISIAANVKPMEDSPKLGIPQDFSNASKGFKYKVVAADGKTTKVWTITSIKFIK